MTKAALLTSIISDLGANYSTSDANLLSTLLDEMIDEALFISNRKHLATDEIMLNLQLDILSPNIRRAVKTVYLQRGAEDVVSQSRSGLNSTYDKAIETMQKDIARTGKRIVI